MIESNVTTPQKLQVIILIHLEIKDHSLDMNLPKRHLNYMIFYLITGLIELLCQLLPMNLILQNIVKTRFSKKLVHSWL